MLKLLKQKIGFSWKTGWERFPTPRKISEISGDFYLSTNCDNGFKKGMEDEDAEQSEETVKKADKKDEDEE